MSMRVNLFTPQGELVAKIVIPEPPPGIVVYKGIYFRLENGRYVQSTLFEHIGD